jgi:diguanylate cyclase (GGDEF)-like protein/PAS domain S-box-containing protein
MSGISTTNLPEDRVADFLLQGAGIGTWVWNEQTGETRFNETWAQIVGYTLSELQPTTVDTWTRLTHEDDLPVCFDALQKHFAGELSQYRVEFRMRHKAGHWVRVLVCGQVLIHDEQGQPLWMFGSHMDITDRWLLEQQHTELLGRLNRLFVNLPGYLYQYRLRPDGTSHFPFATEAIERAYGCLPAAVEHDATPVFQVLHPDDFARVSESIAASASALTVWHERYRVNHPTRGLIWVKGNATPEREADGSILWHGYLRDVTDEQLQREQLQLASKVFASSQEGIIITDAQNLIVDVNEAFERISGFSRQEIIGQPPSVLSSGRQPREFYEQMWKQLNETGRWQGEIWNRRHTGEVYAELMSIDTVRGEDGKVSNYFAIFTDISHFKEHQSELDRIAHYDALTGLPNRRLLDDRLAMALAHAQRREELLAVCFLDLDNFKGVNDTYGHEVGDKVLVQTAQGIRSVLRAQDTVARIGGDEFVLLLTELKSRSRIIEVMQRVLEVARLPLDIDGKTIALSASAGVAIYPEIDLSADELVRYADQAMYRAKQQGRNRFILFDANEEHASRARQGKLKALQAALAGDEFEMHYQPKVDLRTGEIWSVEALIRWPQHDGALRLPGEFIDSLSGSPLELDIGRWVINEVLRQQRVWAEAGLSLPVSINISVDHLLSERFVQELEEILQTHGVQERSQVVLEILETSRIADFVRTRLRVLECKALGVRFSLDDFGTGYSSLTYMRQLPVDALKIDKSFVIAMLENAEDRKIVEGIIALGHAFGRQVIAEGAESEEHLRALKALECDCAQGYGVARPMPAADIAPWCSKR